MKIKMLFIMAILLSASCINAKTLVVYYSFTNNVHTIVNNLHTQIDADVIRIEPAEKGIDYADNNYAAGSALISAIRTTQMMWLLIQPSILLKLIWMNMIW